MCSNLPQTKTFLCVHSHFSPFLFAIQSLQSYHLTYSWSLGFQLFSERLVTSQSQNPVVFSHLSWYLWELGNTDLHLYMKTFPNLISKALHYLVPIIFFFLITVFCLFVCFPYLFLLFNTNSGLEPEDAKITQMVSLLRVHSLKES